MLGYLLVSVPANSFSDKLFPNIPGTTSPLLFSNCSTLGGGGGGGGRGNVFDLASTIIRYD